MNALDLLEVSGAKPYFSFAASRNAVKSSMFVGNSMPSSSSISLRTPMPPVSIPYGSSLEASMFSCGIPFTTPWSFVTDCHASSLMELLMLEPYLSSMPERSINAFCLESWAYWLGEILSRMS